MNTKMLITRSTEIWVQKQEYRTEKLRNTLSAAAAPAALNTPAGVADGARLTRPRCVPHGVLGQDGRRGS
jgi:hypothetical protein